MFSPDPDRSAPRSVRAALRDFADMAIAFMTLEGYGLDDLRPGRHSSSHGHHGAQSEDAAARPSTSGAPGPHAAAGSPAAHDVHRRELRRPSRTRRPGTAVARPQLCLTPLEPSPAPHTAALRRRTAPQDAPL